MEIREKIQQKCERIAASIADHGHSESTEIATQEEMHWLALQMALRGVLFSYSAAESMYKNGEEIYYYYWAISASEKRDKVDGFLRCYPVLSASELNKLYILAADDSRQYKNVKLVRRQVMRRDRQRRQREKRRTRSRHAGSLRPPRRLGMARQSYRVAGLGGDAEKENHGLNNKKGIQQ